MLAVPSCFDNKTTFKGGEKTMSKSIEKAGVLTV